MNRPLVVNCRVKRYDVFGGRRTSGMRWGNPFSHHGFGLARVRVATREEAIARFTAWLDGVADKDVEPERLRWIREHLPELKCKVLGCFCAPLVCHCDVLAERANPDAPTACAKCLAFYGADYKGSCMCSAR